MSSNPPEEGAVDEYTRGSMTFDVIDRGPADGEPVVLLHGFPQFNTSWHAVMDRLVAQGYRCLAPNQRGYSPRARPPRRRDYRPTELIGDIVTLLDAIEAPKVHLVGHDWGAEAAWGVAAAVPERLATLSALSAPHPTAFIKAMLTSRQGLASWYIYAFQLPKLPELMLSRKGGRVWSRVMHTRFRQSRAAAERDTRAMLETGALTGAVNWYRAIPLVKRRTLSSRISVPTMFIWGDGDVLCLEPGARDNQRFVSAPYRFETLAGVSHWIPDEAPDRTADLLLEWFAEHPVGSYPGVL
jgi:pimeloyl-ACP methyl ester carboxylesterase